MSYFLSKIQYIIQKHPMYVLQKEIAKNSRTLELFAKNITQYYLSSYFLCQKMLSVNIHYSCHDLCYTNYVFQPEKMANEEYNKGTCLELCVVLFRQR